MIGKAEAFGAISIVNGMASGKGSSLGVKLRTVCHAELKEHGKTKIEIIGNPDEDSKLGIEAIKTVLKHYEINKSFNIKIWSQIPIGKGLKSSSAAANAIVSATSIALNKKLSDMKVIDLGVDAALSSNVSITGAYDDAAASYLGGLIITDNYKRKIIKRDVLDPNLKVVILVPDTKLYTKNLNKTRFQKLNHVVDQIHNLAINGKYWEAMSLNGFVYSSVFGFDSNIILDALKNDALGASLSGSGPSFAAICHNQNVKKICRSWKTYSENIIVTDLNNHRGGHINE